MKIRKFSILNDGVYKISLYTEEWSELDLKLMEKYGEPEVDLGGSFTGPPELDLSANLVSLRAESPFTQSFDSDDYVDADERAVVWKEAVVTRIKSAVTALRANTDDFSGETVENV